MPIYKSLGVVVFVIAICAYPNLVLASDLDDLTECNINVYKEIAKTQAWSGRTKGCAKGKVLVEKRESGAFITSWNLVKSNGYWEKLALSTAIGYGEMVDNKLLGNAIKDVKSRTKRLKTCLDSIQERNDPGECRDTAKKVYSVGDMSGVDIERTIWIDDSGRHVVLGFSYGNSAASDTVPADLEKTPGIPPGVLIELHQGQGSSDGNKNTPTGARSTPGKNK